MVGDNRLRGGRRPWQFFLRPRLKVTVEAEQEQTPGHTRRNTSSHFTLKKTRWWRGSNSLWVKGVVWGRDSGAPQFFSVSLSADKSHWIAQGEEHESLASPDPISVRRTPKKMPLYLPYHLLFDWIPDDEPSGTDDEGKPFYAAHAEHQDGFLELQYEVNGKERRLLLAFYADPAESGTVQPDGEWEWDGDSSSIEPISKWNLKARLRAWRLKRLLDGR